MRQRINKNLILIALLAVLASVISITYIYYGMFQERVRSDLEVCIELLKDTHYLESPDIDPEAIDLKTDIRDLRVTWISEDGHVLYDNDNTAAKLENHLNRSEIIDAINTGKGEAVRVSDTMSVNTFYYALRLDNGTILRVATEAQSIFVVFAGAAPAILIIVLIIVMVCVLLSQVLTSQIVKPIENIAENIDRPNLEAPYNELHPFLNKIKHQHETILENVQVKQDFTANVSHELKTPLTSISGYAELMEFDKEATKQQKHFAGEIRKNANRLLKLIEDILYLSKLDDQSRQIEMDRVDLKNVVKRCINEVAIAMAERRIKLSSDLDECYVRGNEDMLYELVENLIQNAIRYNVEGGTIFVSLKNVGEEVKLIVKDSGIGIPEKDQAKVFERFYRVDKSRSKKTGGTGLGLAIVKHIAEIHGAAIDLQSKEKEGTAITVTFH